MSTVQERYQPRVVGVNASITLPGTSIGGFLAKTTGTVSVTLPNGTVIVDAVPVTAGVYLPLPFYLAVIGSTVTTAGGASGTVAV